jgi:hypothetical protein
MKKVIRYPYPIAMPAHTFRCFMLMVLSTYVMYKPLFWAVNGVIYLLLYYLFVT